MGRAPKVRGLPDRLGREPFQTIFEVAFYRYFVAELVAMSKDPDAPSPKLADVVGLPSDYHPSFPPKRVKEELEKKGEDVPPSLYDKHRELVEEGVLRDAGYGLYQLDPAVFETLLWDNTLRRLKQPSASEVATYPIEAERGSIRNADGSPGEDARLSTPEGTTQEEAATDVPRITGVTGMTAAAHVIAHDDFDRGGPDLVQTLREDEELQSILLEARGRIRERIEEVHGSTPARMDVVLSLWGGHLRLAFGRKPSNALGETIPLDVTRLAEEE